jgi:hypothetical protein
MIYSNSEIFIRKIMVKLQIQVLIRPGLLARLISLIDYKLRSESATQFILHLHNNNLSVDLD